MEVRSPRAWAVAARENGEPVSEAAPARRGEKITLYGTGFGPCDRPRPDGFALPESPAFNIVDSVEVSLGGVPVQAESPFGAPGKIGVDAVAFRVPPDSAGGGTLDLNVRVNGVESNTVLLPVE